MEKYWIMQCCTLKMLYVLTQGYVKLDMFKVNLSDYLFNIAEVSFTIITIVSVKYFFYIE